MNWGKNVPEMLTEEKSVYVSGCGCVCLCLCTSPRDRTRRKDVRFFLFIWYLSTGLIYMLESKKAQKNPKFCSANISLSPMTLVLTSMHCNSGWFLERNVQNSLWIFDNSSPKEVWNIDFYTKPQQTSSFLPSVREGETSNSWSVLILRLERNFQSFLC